MKKKKVLYSIIILVMVTVVLLYLWELCAEGGAHYTPDYPMVSLRPYVEKEELAKEDYKLLFEQTGLGKPAIDTLWEEGRQEEIISVQECFFEKVTVTCENNTAISKEECLCKDGENYKVYIPVIEEGDILITFSTHVFGWRVGHAALVVDAVNQRTLEARVLGTDSAVMTMSHWQEYPSFAVLRFKGMSLEERMLIAENALDKLKGITYSLHAGLLGQGEGTHCSHLVWSAYKCSGYDLDSDGNWPVTPRDIFESPLLEVVQLYGMNPEALKKY